jgi:hypothetical protein
MLTRAALAVGLHFSSIVALLRMFRCPPQGTPPLAAFDLNSGW